MTIEGPRACRQEELDSAIDLADRVFRVGWGSSMRDDFPLLFAESNLDRLRVFSDGGRVVSLVGMVERDILLLGTRHVSCCIGAVCTEPDYRGQGLATRLLRDAMERALGEGVDIFLISGGRGLYRRLGFVDVGSYWTCEVDRAALPAKCRYTVRDWRPEDMQELVRLRAAEQVRFVRPPDDFVALVGTGKVLDAPGEFKIVCHRHSGEPVAYLAFQTEGRPGSEQQGDILAVREVAGSRRAALEGLGWLLDRYGRERGVLDFLDCDVEMKAIAASVGLSLEPHGFHGTVGIIDPVRFWRECRPLFVELLGPEEADRLELTGSGPYELKYGTESLTLPDMSAVTRLVFLPRHRRGELEPAPPPDSALARLLAELLPLPLVDYGLNFI